MEERQDSGNAKNRKDEALLKKIQWKKHKSYNAWDGNTQQLLEKSALHLRHEIKRSQMKQPRPPQPDELLHHQPPHWHTSLKFCGWDPPENHQPCLLSCWGHLVCWKRAADDGKIYSIIVGCHNTDQSPLSVWSWRIRTMRFTGEFQGNIILATLDAFCRNYETSGFFSCSVNTLITVDTRGLHSRF